MTFLTVALAGTAIFWTLTPIFAPPESALRASVNVFIPLSILSILAVIFAVLGNNGLPDRLIYTNELQYIAGHNLGEALGLSFSTAREPFYILFMWLVSNNGQTTAWLYFCVGTACVAAYVMAILRLVPLRQAPLIWLTTLALGFFTNYAGLVARQGLSMAALFAAICFILAGARSRWWIAFLVVSSLLHWSAIPIAVAVAAVALIRVPLRIVLALWGAAALCFVAGVQERVIGPVAGMVPGLNDYVNPSLSGAYPGGINRLDFFLFSLGILVTGLLALRWGATPPWYHQLIVIYGVLNVYFLLFGFILYSDRLGAYSWSLAPLILAVPFAHPKTATGRMRTIGFVAAVVVFGLVAGPFQQMIGVTSY